MSTAGPFEFQWLDSTSLMSTSLIRGIPFPVSQNDEVVIIFATNVDQSKHSGFNAYANKCDNVPYFSDYTLQEFTPLGELNDGTIDILVTLNENLLSGDKICIKMVLLFGMDEVASKEYVFTPLGIIDSSSATTAPVTANNLVVSGAGEQTAANVEPDAGERNGVDGSGSGPSQSTTYGEETIWAVTGDSRFWYRILNVKAGGESVSERELSLGYWDWCETTKGTAYCGSVIPISFYSNPTGLGVTLTATITYEWYANDPNDARLLSDEEHLLSGTGRVEIPGSLLSSEGGVDLGRLLQSGAVAAADIDDDIDAGRLSGTGSVETTIALAPLPADYEEKDNALLLTPGNGNGFEMNVKNTAIISAAAVALFGLVIAALAVLIVSRRWRKMEQNYNNDNGDKNNSNKSNEPVVKSLEETDRTIRYGNDSSMDDNNSTISC